MEDESFLYGSVEPTQKPKRAKKARSIVSEVSRTLLLALLVIFGARTLVLPYEVEGASMTPNLHDRERVLVNRMVYFHFDLNALIDRLPGIERQTPNEVYPFHAPERGDIIVLHPPVASAEPYIKRVIGLPGEQVSFKDGWVYIDGERLDEPYITDAITRCDTGPNCDLGVIPDGYVFVLGDNRRNSSDSRVFGLVRINDIVGKAWFANWPLDQLGLLPHYDYTP